MKKQNLFCNLVLEQLGCISCVPNDSDGKLAKFNRSLTGFHSLKHGKLIMDSIVQIVCNSLIKKVALSEVSSFCFFLHCQNFQEIS